MKCLNLGCGDRFHPDWTNLDFVSNGHGVHTHDLRRGISFEDNTFDVVYLSHLLEHFGRKEGQGLLEECHRVLLRGGTIRVVVPDLERIARLYLEALEKASSGDPAWQAHYDWMMLEMYDQTVRERSGGAMREYFQQESIPNEAFVHERLGGEARRMVQELKSSGTKGQPASLPARARFQLRSRVLKLLLGDQGCRALELGRFRMGGEVHKWMYDRYSLACALLEAGFAEPRPVGPAESRIPGWAGFHLDTEPDGTVYKPDSLYMEAIKP